LFCIIGFGGVITRSITGLTIFILSGTISGINKIGVSHRWHVPKWTLLALIFTKLKIYSIDYLINRYIDDHYNLEPNYIIFVSGFSSKFVQCVSLYTLFAGGISKLRNSGLSWIHPGNLAFHFSDPSANSITTLKTIRIMARTYVLQHQIFLSLTPAIALILELTVVLAIFLPSTRLPIFLLANLFHIVIWLLLLPNYFTQCICYLMIIDRPSSYTIMNVENLVHIHFFDKLIICIGVFIISGYVYSLIFQYEGWPFTSIPMYSFQRCQFTHEYIIDENQFFQLAYEEYPLMNGFCTDGEEQYS
ncbi:unnamed protein product, partial [Rotaria sp. Silwood1]